MIFHARTWVGKRLMVACLTAVCLIVTSMIATQGIAFAEETRTPSGYQVRSSDPDRLTMAAPTLPSLERYTRTAVEAKIDRTKTAHVSLKRMIKQPALEDFTAGERLSEWATRQFSHPQAIFIEQGYADIRSVARQIDKQFLEEVEPGIFVARLPIVVGNDGILEIGADVKALRLSEERGAFLVNDGKLFLIGTQLTGWRETSQTPAHFVDEKTFRPFLVSWGGTQLYVVDSVVESLGYHQSKSYGFTITQYTSDLKVKQNRRNPTGWIIGSTFDDLYYGFYCYEADDVVIIKNTYKNNVVYGIDPHDRSSRLIIAENDAFDTHYKHGIIISREVNDSFIFNNRAYNNKLSGIVIDRNSERNIVASNWVAENGSDGITIYESPNNLLWENVALANKRHGIRLRNSLNIKLYKNVAISNQRYGLYGHIKDLSATARNFKLDPYASAMSMTVVGGGLASNVRGPLSIDRPMALQMYGVDFRTPDNRNGVALTGVLSEFQEPILDILFRQRKAVIVEPVFTDNSQAKFH